MIDEQRLRWLVNGVIVQDALPILPDAMAWAQARHVLAGEPQLPIAETVPAAVTLAGPFPPMPLDQGSEPACTIFSAASIQRLHEAYALNRMAIFGYEDLIKVFREIQVDGNGAYLHDALDLWADKGLPAWLPRRRWLKWVNWWGAMPGYSKHYLKRGFYSEIARDRMNRENVTLCLHYYRQPGYIALGITEGFLRTPPEGIVWPRAGDKLYGHHAMAVLGCVPQGIVVAHTWGTRPPQVISWEYFEQYCAQFFLVTDAPEP